MFTINCYGQNSCAQFALCVYIGCKTFTVGMSIKEVHCHWNDKAPQPPPPFYHPEYRFQFALPRFEVSLCVYLLSHVCIT